MAEMRILRLTCDKTRKNKLRDEYITEAEVVAKVKDKVMERRLRCHRYVQHRV